MEGRISLNDLIVVQKPDSEKKPLIQTEEPDLSFGEWKKKFREEHPTEKPTYQLYTIERLEKRKEQLIKELKKTSGVFKDKLTFFSLELNVRRRFFPWN